MLSYQHAFHAGNHADLLKHYVLSYVLNYLNKKEKPYTMFDTHSASGQYDLLDNRSLKTGESADGVSKLMSSGLENAPDEFMVYLEKINDYYKKGLYPGSPKIEEAFLREQDYLVLSELHPQEIQNLKNNFHNSTKNIQIHNRDGWEMIKALTPPKTKRGAVLIDPSYEELSDYKKASETISFVNKKWSNGIIMLWYPLLAYRQTEIEEMKATISENVLKNNPNTEISDLTLCVAKKDSHKEVALEENAAENKKPRLYGSGMLIINPPYQLEENAKIVIKYIEGLLFTDN